MFLTQIFTQLIVIYAPVVIAYIFIVILFDIVVRGFRGLGL